MGTAGARLEYRERMSHSLTEVEASDALSRRCSRPAERKDRDVMEMSPRRPTAGLSLHDSKSLFND